jgi:hypothetical protein
VLAIPLSLTFSAFLSVGPTPKEWAHAIIMLDYRSALASDIANYRPISLTCVSCKDMERTIASQMLVYLRSLGVFDGQQHGFLSGRSTTTNLLETLNDWTLALQDNDQSQ